MFSLPSRFQSLVPAGTVQFLATAAQRKAAGEDVISLAAAEPFTRTADAVSQAGIAAIAQHRTHYAGAEGTPELKQALRAKLLADNGLAFSADEIVVSNGTKPLMMATMLALTEEGDEVIVPTPHYNAYPEIVKLAGARPVLVPCPQADNFLLRPQALADAITPRTRALFLANPNNPTGAVYTAAEWVALATVLDRHPQVYVVVDEIFEHLHFDRAPVSPAFAVPSWRERVIVINGFSKGYSMNGWRVGFAAGPVAAMRAVATIAAHVGGPPSPIAQAGAVAALMANGKVTGDEMTALRVLRDETVDALNAIDGLSCHVPDAAFLVFPSCRGVYGRRLPGGVPILSDHEYAQSLLSDAGVAVAPGSGFGIDGHFRLSFAPGPSVVHEALARIRRFHARLVR